MSGRLEELERLKAEVGALDRVFQTDTDYEHASYKVGVGWLCVGVDACGWDADVRVRRGVRRRTPTRRYIMHTQTLKKKT